MIVKTLIEKLNKIDPTYQIYLSNDPEGNEVKTIDDIYLGIFEKTNNNGTYDAYVIYPTNELIDLIE